MFTVWMAVHEAGYTYTRDNFDIKDEESANKIVELLVASGHTAVALPFGTPPSWYQAPDMELGVSAAEFIEIFDDGSEVNEF